MTLDPDSFINELHLKTLIYPPKKFQSWAMEYLHDCFRFDSAVWLTLNDPFNPSGVHLHNHSEQLIRDYYSYAQHTTEQKLFFEQVENEIGSVVFDEEVVPQQELNDSQIWERYFKPHGIIRGLGYSGYMLNSSFKSSIYLNRREVDDVYNEDDRLLLNRLLPKLVATNDFNLILHTESAYPRTSRLGVCLCDGHGQLKYAQSNFTRLLVSEFPGWRGQTLPIPVDVDLANPRVQILHQNGPFKLTLIPMGVMFICTAEKYAVNKALLNSLTKAEHRVAEYLAQGYTIPEVSDIVHRSKHTLKTQTSTIRRKLEIDSIRQIKAFYD